MGRALQIHGGTYYLRLSSSGRRPLLEGPDDAHSIESLAAKAVCQATISVHAYCWLPREIHIAIDLLSNSLTSVARNFAASFARDKNRRTNCAGPLFSHGYSAILIYPQTHLLPLIRYIHLLPVYLGTARSPLEYRWSSHRAFLDGSTVNAWLSPSRALTLLSTEAAAARSLYADYTRAPLTPMECCQFCSGISALGPQEWLTSLKPPEQPRRNCQSLENFVAALAINFGVNPFALASRSQSRRLSRIRALIARAAITEGVATLSEIARAFNRSPSAVYLAIQNHTTAAPGCGARQK